VIAPNTPWRYWGRPASVTGSRRPRRTATRNCSITLALVLDESTAGMGSWRMTDKVHELWEREKITVVEHDMDIVFKIAALIFVLCYGRILATATIADLKVNGNIRQRYLALQVSRPRAIVTDLRCRWLGLTD